LAPLSQRTATVVAKTDADLYALEREPFLLASLGTPARTSRLNLHQIDHPARWAGRPGTSSVHNRSCRPEPPRTRTLGRGSSYGLTQPPTPSLTNCTVSASGFLHPL
jgi:hypothetical protein